MGKELKETNTNNVENGLDPFGGEDDDDVRRIALEMEAKYVSNILNCTYNLLILDLTTGSEEQKSW